MDNMYSIHMDLIRVTEAAAIAASAWVGGGDKESADKAASNAMKDRLSKIDAQFTVVIGEGKKDKSYGLFPGEVYGNPSKDASYFDMAVDPIEGTTPTVTSGPEAISTFGLAGPGCLFETEEFYMNKLAYGPAIANKVKLSLSDPIEKIIEMSSEALNKPANRMMVCILDRPRHSEIIFTLRKMGVRIKLIQDCDVSGAIAACMPDSGVDIMYGIGGAPECVLTACAIKCLRGDLQAQVTSKEGEILDSRVLGLEDLAKGDTVFAATGITDGSMLEGVRFTEHGPVTNSIFMRSKSGTIREVKSYHGN